MKIAVCSQNRRNVTAHAGRCRRFRIFECNGQQIAEQEMIELGIDETFRATQGNEPLALEGNMDALITKGMGDGLKRKLESRGIDWWETDLSEPLDAVSAFLEGLR